MYMSFKLLDIFCLSTFVMLPLIALRMRSLWKRLDSTETKQRKWSLWLCFIGLFLSIISLNAANFWPIPKLFEAMVGLYGVSFYALLYHLNPFLRERLRMPWRTSVRLYLLTLLVGVTTYKIGGAMMSVYFFAICSALGAMMWSRYSIIQTIVMITQLVLSLVVIFLSLGAMPIWLGVVGAMSNVTIFLLDSKLRESK